MSRATPIVTVTAQIASDDAFGVQDDVSLMRAILPGEDIVAVFRPFAGDAPSVAYRPALSSMQIPCLMPFVLCFTLKDSQRRYYRLLKTFYVITSTALYTVVTDGNNAPVEDPISVSYEMILRAIPKEQSSCFNPAAIHIQTIAEVATSGIDSDDSGFYWYTPEANTCADIILEALYRSRYSASHAPFALTVPPAENSTHVRVFLLMKDSVEEATVIRISNDCSWEEFDAAATTAMKLPVGNCIKYEYHLESVEMLEANDRIVVTPLE